MHTRWQWKQRLVGKLSSVLPGLNRFKAQFYHDQSIPICLSDPLVPATKRLSEWVSEWASLKACLLGNVRFWCSRALSLKDCVCGEIYNLSVIQPAIWLPTIFFLSSFVVYFIQHNRPTHKTAHILWRIKLHGAVSIYSWFMFQTSYCILYISFSPLDFPP